MSDHAPTSAIEELVRVPNRCPRTTFALVVTMALATISAYVTDDLSIILMMLIIVAINGAMILNIILAERDSKCREPDDGRRG